YLLSRHVRTITAVLEVVARGVRPDPFAVSKAIVRALNLPYLSFLGVPFFPGPAAAILGGTAMVISNHILGSGYEGWQILGVTLAIFFFASPAHAIAEFFVTARQIVPE